MVVDDGKIRSLTTLTHLVDNSNVKGGGRNIYRGGTQILGVVSQNSHTFYQHQLGGEGHYIIG